MAARRLFRGFFSYAHLDAEAYPSLVDSYTVTLAKRVNARLTKAELAIWRDTDRLRTGDRWDPTIEQELRASKILIVLLSPPWIGSDYCRKEYAIFEEVESPGGDYVAPIMIYDLKEEVPFFDDSQKQTYAKLLERQFKRVLASESPEPSHVVLEKIAEDIARMIRRLFTLAPEGAVEFATAEEVPEEVIEEISAQATGGGLDENVVRELARRLKPEEVLDTEQAVKELESAVEIAREVIAKGGRVTNQQAFVAEISKEVAGAVARGEIDAAAEAVEAALAELDRHEVETRDAEKRTREAVLELGLKQDLLRRDAFAAAARIEAIVALETPEDPCWSAPYRARWDALYEEGEAKGVNLSLECAAEMARRMLLAAHDADQRGTALILLGNALQTVGARESGSARLEEAVTAFRAALEEYARDRVPPDWAMTQMNLGNALVCLGKRESGTATLEEAVTAFRAALEELTRDRVPLDWARTQNNLGTALQTLGERESGTATLEEAVKAYRAALEELTRDRVPLDWAMTQNNLGTALQTLGERESGTATLEEAVKAYRAALEELTRDRVPLQWAMTQNNLGNALQTLGARESGTATLEEAVKAYRAALEERTRARVPLQWARTTGNQGVALMLLAERRSDSKVAKQALGQIEAAFATLRDGGDVAGSANFDALLPEARALVARLSNAGKKKASTKR
jgi:tetratricopeptide (TPR) repeat protein